MNEIVITANLSISRAEIDISAVRAQGAGGQHVNKVSTGIHLRFDIGHSSLPDQVKQRLLQRHDQRLTDDGVLIIKAQQSRSQEQNRKDAVNTLVDIIRAALQAPKKRKNTRPSKSAVTKRLDNKKLRGKVKEMRQKVRH